MKESHLLKNLAGLKSIFLCPGIIAAFVLSCFTYKVGKTGLYLFDLGINYHYGWLIYNGYIPFVDFKTPLAPLSGFLTALGYCLFGVTYISSVYVASVLVFFGTLVMYFLLRKIFNSFSALVFTIALSLGHLPIVGTLYYNHIGFLLVSLFVLSLLVRVCDLRELDSRSGNRHACFMWFVLTLISLNKVHVGVAFSIVALALELTWIKEFLRMGSVQRVRFILYRMFWPGVAILGLLVYVRFDLSSVVDSLTIPAIPPNRFEVWFNKVWTEQIDLQLPRFVNDVPKISLVFFSMLFFTGLGPAVVQAGSSIRLLRITILSLLFFGVSLVLSATSDEAQIGHLNTGILLMILSAACSVISAASSTKYSLFRDQKGMVALLFYLIIYQGSYALQGMRKSWNETAGNWLGAPIENRVRIATGFFNKLWVRPEQADTIQFINDVEMQNRAAKIYFGPELEMFYASTGRLPPKGWILWSHPKVSMREADYPSLTAIFEKEDFQIALFSKKREYLWPYLTQLSVKYKKNSSASTFVELFQKR